LRWRLRPTASLCKSNGPATWARVAPAANGKRQSPINIEPAKAQYDPALAAKPFSISYDPSKAGKLLNNGHSAQVTFDSEGSSLTGGPLDHKYQVAQFHLHWGKSDDTGSEHRIDNKMYAAELHIVHWNTELFKSVGDAIKEDKGLCVLGMFLKVGKEHAGLKKMTDKLAQIPYSGDSIDLTEGFDPTPLLPSDTSKYYTYLGSLTTPPLFESVTWVVFQEPIEVSEAQMQAFRSLNETAKGSSVAPGEDDFKGKIVENYRPPLPVGDRLVRSSFKV